MKIVTVPVLSVREEIEHLLKVNPNVAKKSDNKDMGKPFGKASTCLRVAAPAYAKPPLRRA
jgi:hypothetical protein